MLAQTGLDHLDFERPITTTDGQTTIEHPVVELYMLNFVRATGRESSLVRAYHHRVVVPCRTALALSPCSIPFLSDPIKGL